MGNASTVLFFPGGEGGNEEGGKVSVSFTGKGGDVSVGDETGWICWIVGLVGEPGVPTYG